MDRSRSTRPGTARTFDGNRAAVMVGAYFLIGAVLGAYGFPVWTNFLLMLAIHRASRVFDRRMAEVDMVLAAEASLRRESDGPGRR